MCRLKSIRSVSIAPSATYEIGYFYSIQTGTLILRHQDDGSLTHEGGGRMVCTESELKSEIPIEISEVIGQCVKK